MIRAGLRPIPVTLPRIRKARAQHTIKTTINIIATTTTTTPVYANVQNFILQLSRRIFIRTGNRRGRVSGRCGASGGVRKPWSNVCCREGRSGCTALDSFEERRSPAFIGVRREERRSPALPGGAVHQRFTKRGFLRLVTARHSPASH